MKKLAIILCLAFATPMVGCAAMKQSNRTHHAIEDQTKLDVEKVVIQVKNGKKTVIVHLNKKKNVKKNEEMIRDIVMEQVPDAQAVKIKTPK